MGVKMRLDILTKFKYKKKMWITPRHPLYFEALEAKVLYGTGVFMHAGLNKTVNTLNNFELERLLTKGLGLSSKEMTTIIRLAREEKRILDQLLEYLKTPSSKYLFLLDLANVSMRSTPLSEEELQSIRVFSELLGVSEKERQLIIRFIQSAFASDAKNCISIYERMQLEKMQLSMTELKYYMPELDYVTRIEEKILTKGDTLQLVDQCEIRQSIQVTQGSTLCIANATIELYGVIVVDGGTLKIQKSKLIRKSDDNRPFIIVKNYSNVIIEDTEMDCRYISSAINQNNGNLTLTGCKIQNARVNSAVLFWGDQINIMNSTFHDCYTTQNGAAILIQNGSGQIKTCKFYDCDANNGGAIYASNRIMIMDCRFHSCAAKEYGAAIFYHGEVKSNISDCVYSNCYPEKEEIIQYIGDLPEKVIRQEYQIHVSTLLDCKLIVEELGVLEIENAVIFSNFTIQCEGILNMKHSKIIAKKFNGRDLINVSNARGCNISYCDFNGSGMAGALCAKGSRVKIRHSIFRNTAEGRAVFNPLSPSIYDCTFSYCLGGAIYTQGGKIENCTMINCRAKSGAGILMYGNNKGEIVNCKFIRCISDYSGGAIDKTGIPYIAECQFEECKPNNIS
jgi:hypothetical protein